ncbi:aminotransferase class III-fold pyridoxal phosphate-dependent enzyme [Variovorax sp. RB2P76]|uniref:aminotransferase class III-fold pyridoxal phosphate-dependent enzyme n=1 Tax=Variovorax sp. RB2P76 TaxID=3443736 RepID=UPI003F487BDB
MNAAPERTATVAATGSHFMVPWSRQGAPQGARFSGGSGVFLHTVDGRKCLDLSSGLMCANLGHGHPMAIDAIKRQLDALCFVSPTLGNDCRDEFSAQLCARAPWAGKARVHFTTGGGEANDDAVKIARMATGRLKVLCAYRSYHGTSAGSAALTGGSRRWASEQAAPGGVARFFAPYPYRSPFHTDDSAEEVLRALEHLERVIQQENPDNIAAILIEPVLGSDGLVAYGDGYLAGVRALADRYGALLIHDEVMCGFGRVGQMFASQRVGVMPDMVTFAKGVTGAYVPLGGVLMREEVAGIFDSKPFPFGHTYSGHPLCMAAGLGALSAYEAGGLFTRGRQIETWLHEGLTAIQRANPIVGDVRGLGAFFGIELVKSKKTREPLVMWQGRDQQVIEDLQAALLARGVWLYVKYNLCVIAPPLTIARDELESGLEIVAEVLREFAARLRT